MYDSMSIGPSPCDERCVGVGEENYEQRGREECRRFIELLRKKLGPEPPGARLVITSNPHDFGSYYDVECRYDDADEEAAAYAHLCESEAPRTWGDDKPLPKQRYDVSVSLEVRVQVEAESDHMAEVRAKRQAVEKAQQAGFQLEFPREAEAYATRKVA